MNKREEEKEIPQHKTQLVARQFVQSLTISPFPLSSSVLSLLPPKTKRRREGGRFQIQLSTTFTCSCYFDLFVEDPFGWNFGPSTIQKLVSS